MDIILDSNIYLTDIRLQSNRFANFFDYVRRTRSSVILPALVRDEVAQKHREKLVAQLSRVEKEVKELGRYTIEKVAFHGPYPEHETKDLKALLRRPSKGVRTKFLATADGVDLNEVIRRGVKRVPPASESGEELRDVILWLVVIAHAKSTARNTAFITADSGFWESDKPKGQILQDIASQKVDIRLYRDLAQFSKENSLLSEAVTDSWADAHLDAAALDKMVEGPLHASLRKTRSISGSIQKISVSQLRFASGSLYKIDARTDFAELLYWGSFVVETVSVRYPPPMFGDPWGSGQKVSLSNLMGLASLANPKYSLGESYTPTQENEPQTHRSTYDVEAEVRLSCRVEGSNAEVEVDEARPVKVRLRQ